MISVCETYANKYSLSFNPSKSKFLCFNVESSAVDPVFINGKRVEVIESVVHLGNYMSTNITDRNIVGHVCDLYQRSNTVISDFNVCDRFSLDSLHQTYCMHMYECEVWNLSCRYFLNRKNLFMKEKLNKKEQHKLNVNEYIVSSLG